jgi:hypothetical protein
MYTQNVESSALNGTGVTFNFWLTLSKAFLLDVKFRGKHYFFSLVS